MTYAIGATYALLTDLTSTTPSGATEKLPTPFPATYLPYTRVIGANGNGAAITVGPAIAVWQWAWLLKEHFNYFLSLLGNASSINLFIRTRLDDGSFKVFAAQMWRPTSSPLIGSRRANVNIEFHWLDPLPEFDSAEVGDVDASTVAVTFNEDVIADDYAAGVTIKKDGVTQTISSATRQTDHSVVYYVLASPVAHGNTVTWGYAKASGNITSDPRQTALEDVAATAVVNNV